MERSPARRALILLAVTVLIGLVLGFGVPVCPSATILGIPCPGCGLTRATLAVLRGDFTAALHFHPLVFVLAPIFIYLMSSAGYAYVRGPRALQSPRQRSFWTHRATTIAGSLVVTLVLVVWVARFFGFMGGHAELVRPPWAPTSSRGSAR